MFRAYYTPPLCKYRFALLHKILFPPVLDEDLIGFWLGCSKSWGVGVPCLRHCSDKQQQPLKFLKTRPASELDQKVVELCKFVKSAKCIRTRGIVRGIRHNYFAGKSMLGNKVMKISQGQLFVLQSLLDPV